MPSPKIRAAAAGFALAAAGCGHSALAPRVVVVTVDGLVPEAYMHPEAHGLRVPTLRALVASGAYSDGARSVFPTVTYASHTSMATGVFPTRHAVFSNRPFDPFEKNLDGWRWYAEDIKQPTVWELAEQAGMKTALISWPATVGARVTWNVPEFWRGGLPSEEAKISRALATPGLFDAVAAIDPSFRSVYTPPDAPDVAVTDIAAYVLSTHEARLLMVHLPEVDEAQHKHGLWSPEDITAIENADHELGRIEQSIDATGFGPETTLIVASDHGFANVTRMVRPGALLREAELVRLDDHAKVIDWKAGVLVSGGSAYVYLNDPNDAETAEKVTKIFTNLVGAPGSVVARVYDRDAIRAVGGDPSALLAIESVLGTAFASGYGDYEAPLTFAATHGWDPDRAEMRAALLMRGSRVVPGPIADARLVDIGPTVATLLGLPLTGVDGRPVGIR